MTPLEYLLGQKQIDHLVLVPPDAVACIQENLADVRFSPRS